MRRPVRQRRWVRGNRGAHLLEFALVMPLLVVLLVGVADLGLALIRRDKLANAAREGVRIAVIMSPADLLQANPGTVQSVRDVVVNYMNNAGLPATLTAATPCGTALFSWTYCLSNGGQIQIERQHVVNVGGTMVLCSRVRVTYPHSWTIAQVLRLIVPASSMPNSVMIPGSALMKNLT